MEVEDKDLFFQIKTPYVSLKLGWILNSGFLKGESEYLVGTEEIVKDKENPLVYLNKVKWAVFNGKEGKRITDYYNWISPLGLVKGQSDFFRVTMEKKEALFTLEGKKTEWFDKIRDRGALTGESKFFWGKKNGFYALYHIETGEKLTPDFKSSVMAGAVLGNSNYVVGSYGNEIFFIYDIKTGRKVSSDFDEEKLISILKKEDLESEIFGL